MKPAIAFGTTLAVMALIALHLWFLLALVLGVGFLYSTATTISARRALAKQRRRELEARADQQLRWLTEGDPRGVFGAPTDPPREDLR